MTKTKMIRKRNNTQMNVSSIVRNVIESRAEKKYYTFTPASAVAATAAGTVYNLTRDLVEGDTVEQRSGRKIQVVESLLRVSATLPALGLAGLIRLIWVTDQMNTGVLPAVTDILDSASPTSFMSLASVSNGRFSIVKDVTYNMVVGGANQHIYEDATSKRKTNIFYNGSTNANTSNGRGAQFLLVLTDLAANAPTFTADYALKYVDI